MASKKKKPLELEEIKRKVKKLQYLTKQKKQANKPFEQVDVQCGQVGFTSDRVLPTKSGMNQEPRNSIREPLMRAKHHLVSETCTAPRSITLSPISNESQHSFFFFFFPDHWQKKPTFDPMHSGTRPSLAPMLGPPIAPTGTWLLFTSQVVV